jgi:thiol-disulfide isomerase/thioredoxin
MRPKIVRIFFTVLLLLIATTVLRGWLGLLVEDVVISFILFFIAAYIFVTRLKYPARAVLLYFSGTLFFLIIVSVLVDGQWPTIGLPNLASSFAGIFCGSLAGSKHVHKVLALSLGLVILSITIWYVASGYKLWANYVFNGSFTGRDNNITNAPWFTYTETGDTFNAAYFKDKYVVLDFWITSCIVCRKQFPHFEQLFQKYERDTNVIFQSVNIPLTRDRPGAAARVMNKEKYRFPKAFADSSITRIFDINGYPVYMLLKNDRVLYKGMYLEDMESLLVERLNGKPF